MDHVILPASQYEHEQFQAKKQVVAPAPDPGRAKSSHLDAVDGFLARRALLDVFGQNEGDLYPAQLLQLLTEKAALVLGAPVNGVVARDDDCDAKRAKQS